MPNRFGGATDWSQTFAYLAQQWDANLERRIEDSERRREEEEAARDQEVFDRYSAGKVSDDEILDYIKRRVRETAYDPKQQAEWKKALLEYTESINDARALSAFEKTRDYAGYIGYLREKLGAMKGNPAKRVQIEQQIRGLIDERDQQSVVRGAERIMLQIERGKADYKDLLDFYREKRRDLRQGSPLLNHINEQIRAAAAQVRAINFETSVARVNELVGNQKLTPQEAAVRLRRLLEASGMQQTDPSRYGSFVDEINRLEKTVMDFGRLQEIDAMLQTGQIDPREAQRLYNIEAERYRLHQPDTYWEIRMKGWEIGHTPIPGQTPLPRPGVLGLPRNQSGLGLLGDAWARHNRSGVGGLRHISQTDGSEFAQVNCVMAAGAMLAHAMGYRGLSGGDLRYLTGDREGGTNLDQLEYAMGRIGVGGMRNWNDRHMSFEKFKARVGQHGQPAVLMGVYANMPASMRANPTLTRGHGIFIAAYDAKKDAFLVYDPAVSKNSNPNYNGVWMSANVIKNYGWGPSYTDSTGTYSFRGQVLLAPPNTLTGDLRARNVKYVSVDDLPQRPETPRNYVGLNHGGPKQRAPGLHPTVRPDGKPRAGNPIPDRFTDRDIPDTVEEVERALRRSGKRMEVIAQLTGAFDAGQTEAIIAGEKYVLTEDLIRKLDDEQLDHFDYDILLAEAAGLDTNAGKLRELRADFLSGVQARNTIAAERVLNTIVRDAERDLMRVDNELDPRKALEVIANVRARIKKVATTQGGINQNAELLDDVNADHVRRLQALDKLLDLADDTETPLDQRIADIVDAAAQAGIQISDKPGQDRLGDLVGMIATATDHIGAVGRGERSPILDQDGKVGYVNNRIRQTMDAAGNLVETSEADLDAYRQEGIRPVRIVVDGPDGPMAIWAVPGQAQTGSYLIQVGERQVKLKINGQDVTLPSGAALGENELRALDSKTLAQMIASGQLVMQEWTVTTIRMPDRTVGGRKIEGGTWVQDPGTGLWYRGRLPIDSRGFTHELSPDIVAYDPETGSAKINYRPYSGASGVPAPYEGRQGSRVQEMWQNGELGLDTPIRGRDGAGLLSDDPMFLPESPYVSRHIMVGGEQVDLRGGPTREAADRTFDARADEIETALKNRLEMAWLHPSSRVMGPYLPGDASSKVDIGFRPGMFDIGPELPNAGAYREAAANPLVPSIPSPTPSPYGPQPSPSRGEIPSPADIAKMATDLGVKLGINKKPPTFAGKEKDDVYRPPQARTPTRTPTRSRSPLPKIAPPTKSVMVGGTRIDVPDTKPAPRGPSGGPGRSMKPTIKKPTFKPPTPPATKRLPGGGFLS